MIQPDLVDISLTVNTDGCDITVRHHWLLFLFAFPHLVSTNKPGVASYSFLMETPFSL